MKSIALAAVVMCGVVTSPITSTAQSACAVSPQKHVLGYQDPQTGAFRPLLHEVPDANAVAVTGTIKLTLTITIKSVFPAGSKLTYACGAGLLESSVNLTTDTATLYEEEASSVATVNGNTATCTLTIPYSWIVPAASPTVDTTFTGSYSVNVINNDGTATSTVLRSTLGYFLSQTTVPASGTTTTAAVSVTL